jgi:gas vesicle protein
MSENGNVRGLAVGLVLGVLIGAGAALLLAPQSGEDTRRLIRKRARRLARGAHDTYDDLKDRVREVKDRARDAIAD